MEKRLIAVTGGIGSGKSEVMRILKEQGEVTLSADGINSELFGDSEYLDRLYAGFPEAVIDGKIDKRELSKIVFGNEKKRELLNSIAHPEIMSRIAELASKSRGDVFVEVPLLSEIGRESDFDAVWLVKADAATRVDRLKKTRGLDEDRIFAIMKAQADDAARRGRFEIIDNNGTLEELKNKVCGILKSLRL